MFQREVDTNVLTVRVRWLQIHEKVIHRSVAKKVLVPGQRDVRVHQLNHERD